MRLLEVTHRYPPALGGVEIQVEAIARGAAARGDCVTVVTTDLARDRPLERLSPSEAPSSVVVRRHRAVRWIPAPHGLGIVAPGMAADLLRLPADVVHAHAFGMAPTWLAALARRVRNGSLVIETHFDSGRGTPGWRAYARAVTRLTLHRADRVVAHTRLESDLLVSLGVPAEKLVRISNGLDLSEFSGFGVARPGVGPPTILFVGRLAVAQKGLVPLLRAFASLPHELSSARLRLVGQDWGGRTVVSQLARSLGVADRVELAGAVPRAQLLQEYARADVFVLPSLFDCTPVVLMEAMAAGLPIVATRVGGVEEVVTEGLDSVLCAPNDPGGLASSLSGLLSDPAKRRRLGEAGQHGAQRFSWAQVLPKWFSLFDSLDGQQGQAGG